MLGIAAGVAALGFLLVLELVARRHGIRGPVATLAREAIFPPKSGFLLYAGMALMLVVCTWRQRFIALGAAIGIDFVFLLVRWAADVKVTEGHPFGNGAFWVVVVYGTITVTRRTGEERVLLLKGLGLGLLLVVGRKVGDTWLVLTAKTRPMVLDPYLETADHALGNPSWVVGRIVTAAGPIGFNLLDFVYGQLAVAAVVIALYQLRHVAVERRFPGHYLVRTFVAIGLLGPLVYMIFPVVGPVFAYGNGTEHWSAVSLWSHPQPTEQQWAVADLWPEASPALRAPHPVPFDGITPRNCMPSLHTAWATAIFIHSRKGSKFLRGAGTFWLIATLTATLGFGYHYGVDLLAGVVFALTIEAALRAHDRGWDRSGTRLVAHGVTVFAALLASYRYLPLEMARHSWFYGPLLVLAMTSVVYAYVRTTRQWEPSVEPVRHPEPSPEPA
ncbi:phosphatase PAP2 family protein [Streptomyces sp. NPDC007264]|uniref:phosphatase PAP2 family protein n=1 Tax=Streptomyces sp. NPDC007264 TaxID=3364777 RepID=UPI0036DE8B29